MLYNKIEDINNLNPACHNLIVLQLNICGTVLKNELIKLLDYCIKQKSKTDILILCETFLSDIKNALFKMPNYTLISRHPKHKKEEVLLF